MQWKSTHHMHDVILLNTLLLSAFTIFCQSTHILHRADIPYTINVTPSLQIFCPKIIFVFTQNQISIRMLHFALPICCVTSSSRSSSGQVLIMLCHDTHTPVNDTRQRNVGCIRMNGDNTILLCYKLSQCTWNSIKWHLKSQPTQAQIHKDTNRHIFMPIQSQNQTKIQHKNLARMSCTTQLPYEFNDAMFFQWQSRRRKRKDTLVIFVPYPVLSWQPVVGKTAPSRILRHIFLKGCFAVVLAKNTIAIQPPWDITDEQTTVLRMCSSSNGLFSRKFSRIRV